MIMLIPKQLLGKNHIYIPQKVLLVRIWTIDCGISFKSDYILERTMKNTTHLPEPNYSDPNTGWSL